MGSGWQSFTIKDTVLAISDIALEGEKTYYWRVYAQNAGGKGPLNVSRTFTTAYPATPVLNSPADEAEGVGLRPEITRTSTAASDSIQIQISEGGNSFNENGLWLDARVNDAEGGTFMLQDSLKKLFTYYVRIRSLNEFGTSSWTDINQFKTLFPVPDIPSFNDLPEQPDGLELPISLSWAAVEGATSYLLQLSDTEGFDELILEEAVYNQESYELKDLEAGETYYARIASRNAGGFSEFSSPLDFLVYNPVLSANEKLKQLDLTIFPNPTEGRFQIKGLKGDVAYQISIFFLNGKLISERLLAPVSDEVQTFDFSHLLPQIYFIKLTGPDRVFVKKLILK